MIRFSIAAAAAVILGATLPASAASLTFFGQDLNGSSTTRLASHPLADNARSQFLSNLTGVGTETLESFSAGQTSPLTVNFGVAGNATLTGLGNIVSVASGTDGNGRYPISGTKYWDVTGAFSINFSQPVAAFGFYATDVGDFGGRVTLTLANGSSQVVTLPNDITSAANGSVLYFGLVQTSAADQFTSVTFGNTQTGTDVFGFDDFTVGSIQQVTPATVPVPMAVWPGLALLTGMGLWKARKSA